MCARQRRSRRANLALTGVDALLVVIANVIVDSFMQAYVSPDMLGRVILATGAVMFAMMPWCEMPGQG